MGNRFNSDQWNNYRNNVNNFRNNRATEINNSIQNNFGQNSTQTWLLVRQKQPEMPNVPQTAEAGTKGS